MTLHGIRPQAADGASAANFSGLMAGKDGSGNQQDILTDTAGKQLVKLDAPRGSQVTQQTSISSSTSETTVLTAGASGVFHDITSIIFANTSGTATTATVKDATSGTTRLIIECPANDTIGFSFSHPMIQAAAAGNWTVTSDQSIAALEVTVNAVKNV